MFAMLSVSLSLPRRKRFPECAAKAAALYLAFSGITVIFHKELSEQIYLQTFYFLTAFFVIAFSFWICFQASLLEILYNSVLGLLIQYFIYSSTECLRVILKLRHHTFLADARLYQGLLTLLYAVIFTIVAISFARFHKKGSLIIQAKQLIVPIILLPIAANVMNTLFENASLTDAQMLYYRIYSIMVCVSTFTIMLNAFEIGQIKNEMLLLQLTSEKQKEQYEIKKELIDLISLRAHDMKKQLRMIQDGNKLYSDDNLNEIAHNISAYDAFADTGNEVLDVILTDASLRCEKEGIRFTYMIDGHLLNFMEPMDIHAIFGNLIDNAIESVRKLSDPEKRIISVKMTSAGEMLFVHSFNYYDGDLNFSKDALPLTTKENTENHGYGLKSMRLAIQKYGGELNITPENQVFNLSFMLAHPANKSES